MTCIRVKGFQIFRDRHGRMRFYDCATLLAVGLRKAPLGPAEFPTEYGRIAALAEAQAPPQPKEGPLEGIVAPTWWTTVIAISAARADPPPANRPEFLGG